MAAASSILVRLLTLERAGSLWLLSRVEGRPRERGGGEGERERGGRKRRERERGREGERENPGEGERGRGEGEEEGMNIAWLTHCSYFQLLIRERGSHLDVTLFPESRSSLPDRVWGAWRPRPTSD